MNPQLVRDLRSVLQNPAVVVYRKQQNLKLVKQVPVRNLKKEATPVRRIIVRDVPILSVNYNIQSVQDFESQDVRGMVLIIEDITGLITMKKKLSQMEH
jgi:hypothetical protein